ncbi:glycosyltransferase [Cognatishimia sp. MH4019]|uniref:glycosyltransferase n=1 Tax=Cognatishimia sp. MH4019 TaxID=2854030 RepID=UPI001CD80B4A|nr:glycosyltransferase [Cognatishimia sp. MH4019]
MILHVITNFTARAGAEKMLGRLLSASDGEEAVVVSLMAISEHNKARVHAANVRFIALGAHSLVQLVLAIYTLSRLICRERPRVVLCWMYHAMAIGTLAHLLAGRSGALYWTIRQSLDDVSSLSRSTRAAIAFCKRLSRLPRGIIYNSARARTLHEEAGFAGGRATVIPNGFDLPETVEVAPRSPRVFGIVGRLHPQKDHATFFQAAGLAAQDCPDLRIIAAGHGLEASNSAVTEMIAPAGLRADQVTLLGEVEDMAQVYRSLDVLVLSSRTEGFPNVVAEAMSHARPVITTDVGDAAHIVGDTGLTVPQQDVNAMASAIVALCKTDATGYVSLCKRARARIEDNFLIKTIAEDFLASLTS